MALRIWKILQKIIFLTLNSDKSVCEFSIFWGGKEDFERTVF